MKFKSTRFAIPLLLLIGTLLLNAAFGLLPSFYEKFYLHGIFKFIRVAYDYILGSWFPIPFFMVTVSAIAFYLFFIQKKTKRWVKFTNVLFVIFIAFYWLWGFNYQQQTLAERMQYQFSVPTIERLEQEMSWTISQINILRNKLQNDSLPLQVEVYNRSQLKSDFNKIVPLVLKDHDFATAGNPTVRLVQPNGLLMRLKTAGIYVPHAFEGHVDNGLLELEKPFTYAHELAHAYGLTDEGECNYVAFLACMQSDSMIYQYSALIDYSLYLLRDFRKYDKELYAKYKSTFHPGYHADIEAMRENGKKYPDILPGLRDVFYDRYLKTLGVKEGLKSYSKLVAYIIEYKRKSNKETPSIE